MFLDEAECERGRRTGERSESRVQYPTPSCPAVSLPGQRVMSLESGEMEWGTDFPEGSWTFWSNKTVGGGLACWLSKSLMEPVNLSGSLWIGVTSLECETLLPSLNWASAPCPLMLQLSNWHWPYRHAVVCANGARHTSCSSTYNRHHRVSVWLGKYHLSVRMSPWHRP